MKKFEGCKQQKESVSIKPTFLFNKDIVDCIKSQYI